MDVKCCKCKKEYDLASNIFEYEKDTNCPILICPHCNFKHAINFMPFDNKIEDFKKVKKLDLANSYLVILGASRIANALRVDQSSNDNGSVKDGTLWDISSYRYKGNFDTGELSQFSVTLKPDGTKMYYGDQYDKLLYQYTLTTPKDITSANYDGKTLNFTTEVGTAFVSALLSADGYKVYILATTGYIYQYNLGTSWDISTGNYTKNKDMTTDIPGGVTRAFHISENGLKLYVSSAGDETVTEFTLSTAWDISTASKIASKAITEDWTMYGISLNTDGTKMFLAGSIESKIYQYTLSTPWSITTAGYDGVYYDLTSQSATNIRDMYFLPDGSNFYIIDDGLDLILQYELRTAWTKTNDFILATRIYTSKGPLARAYKLRWRDVTDEGVFADVGATGEISYNATTDLTDDGDLLIGEKLCSVQTDYTWQNGLESEGDNLLPNAGTYSLADEYYTEFQWALDCNNAEDEHEYEFELWDVTEGASIGTCLASITMAITVVGGLSMKWNGVAISKWNGVVIDKLNGVD